MLHRFTLQVDTRGAKYKGVGVQFAGVVDVYGAASPDVAADMAREAIREALAADTSGGRYEYLRLSETMNDAEIGHQAEGENRMSDRVISGGRAHITGIHEKGPQGPALKGERLREVRDQGDNGPSDGWYATDCTPQIDGKDTGPMPESEVQAHPGDQYTDQTAPEMQGVTSWDGKTTSGTSGDHQVVRLKWDDELTAGTADLVHEGANHGCSARIKTVGARGRLVNLRYEAANGVVIPLRPSTLNIGRQESAGGAGVGSTGGRR